MSPTGLDAWWVYEDYIWSCIKETDGRKNESNCNAAGEKNFVRWFRGELNLVIFYLKVWRFKNQPGGSIWFARSAKLVCTVLITVLGLRINARRRQGRSCVLYGGITSSFIEITLPSFLLTSFFLEWEVICCVCNARVFLFNEQDPFRRPRNSLKRFLKRALFEGILTLMNVCMFRERIFFSCFSVSCARSGHLEA